MTKTAFLFLLVLPACPPATVMSEGPTIELRVSASSGSFFDHNSSNPSVRRDLDTMNYELTLTVPTYFGETYDGKGYTYSIASALEGNVTPPGVDLTTADFDFVTTSDVIHRREYTSKTPIIIPGTMMGQMATFKMEAIDDEGLRSNVLEISALLE